MKAYITKYALTQGIYEVEGNVCEKFKGSFEQKNYNSSILYFSPFWYLEKEPAIKHAELLRKNKIENLKKQITKLEKLKF